MYFSAHGFEVNSLCHDLYFWGIRAAAEIQKSDQYWEDPMSRLARAQGQLGQAVARHTTILLELASLKAEADQARAEVYQARAEVDQVRAEADQARAEADQFSRDLEDIRGSRIWRILGPARSALDFCKRLLRPRS
jgi:hypothetical protein